MKIKGMKIIDCSANFKQLKQVEERLNTGEIMNNGNIVIKCDIEAEIEPLRNELADILDCETSQILFRYVDEVGDIKR